MEPAYEEVVTYQRKYFYGFPPSLCSVFRRIPLLIHPSAHSSLFSCPVFLRLFLQIRARYARIIFVSITISLR